MNFHCILKTQFRISLAYPKHRFLANSIVHDIKHDCPFVQIIASFQFICSQGQTDIHTCIRFLVTFQWHQQIVIIFWHQQLLNTKMHWLSSLLLTVVLIAILISILLVYRIRKQSVYFRENGIPDLGSRFFQTLWFLAGSGNIVTLEEDVYREAKQLKAPCVGATDIFGMQSTLFITDLDLIKAICVKDFYHFVTRRTLGKQMANGFFDKLLFFMEGHQWKGVRSKLSPAFTTGRLRKIFQTFNNSGIKMERYLQSELDREGESSIDFDLSKLFSKYSLDVISSCAFGVDGKLWEVGPGEMSEIERMGVEFGFKFSWKLIFKLILVSLVPKLVSALGINMNVWESQDFFTSIIKAVIKKRRQDESERRDDFLQLMLDAQQNLLEADDESDKIMNGSDEVDISTMQSSDKKPIVLDDDVVVANSMAFLVAGFDSTHTLLQCFFYSLALNPTVQDKLHKEITTVLEKHGQMATYDAISEMTYLEMTLNGNIIYL